MFHSTHQNWVTFHRSITIKMPGYAHPLPGVFELDFRDRYADDVRLSLSTATGKIYVIGYDATTSEFVLGLMANAHEFQSIRGQLVGDLIYREGAEVVGFDGDGRISLTVEDTTTRPTLPAPLPYIDPSAWPPPVDMSGMDAAQVLAVLERGMPGALTPEAIAASAAAVAAAAATAADAAATGDDRASVAADAIATASDRAASTAARLASESAAAATAADRAAVHADRLAADADAAATAADRLVTDADAAATASDRAAVHADRLATDADAAATAADRVQTSADRAAAAASAAAAVASAAGAAGSATGADASATTAATQAGLASTARTAAEAARDAAATSASTASTQAGLATTARTAAEAARDAASANGKIYATTTAGLAATTSGQYFSVPSGLSDEYLVLYLNNAGSAVEVKRYLSATQAFFNANLRSLLGILNIFDKSTAQDGYVITGGVVSAYVGYWVTDFMPVEPGGYVMSNTTQTGLNSTRSWNFFDKNKTFISAMTAPHSANTAYAVPSNAYWVRTCYPLTSPKSGVMIVQGQTMPPAYIPYGLPNIDGMMPSAALRARNMAIAARPSSTVNLYDKSLRLNNYLVKTDGTLESYVGYSVTNYMPVTPGGSFTIALASVSITTPRGLCFYDVDKNVVSGIAAPFTAGQVVSVPSTAYYCRLSINNSQVDTTVVLEGSQTAANVATHTLATMADVYPWYGRKFAILGDSISANTNWMATATAKMQASVGLFAALAGRKMIDALKTPAGVALTSADFASIDATVLFLGTNDAGLTTLGTISDATSAATFYGQTKLAVETMLGWRPQMRLVLATPMHRTGESQLAYAQAIRDVAALYGAPVLDFERNSGINSVTIPTFLSDTIHPNATGYAACVVPTAVGLFESLRPAS